jgi:hypothetical protein
MILIVYLIENHSHLIKVENHAERACFDMLAIGLDILGPGRFRPGPPRILLTLEVVHRISSVSRGLAPISTGLPIPSSS